MSSLTEYRDENQQLRSSLASQKLRNEELSSTVSKLAKQLNNQADAFRELHAQVADQDRKSQSDPTLVCTSTSEAQSPDAAFDSSCLQSPTSATPGTSRS